ncbi:GTP-binding protein [Mycena sanguinolenta]|uniref:GTP-binding protein n=1 Tax=Mycena sanguinolenta TaxID=230812 RepID=A0A8H6XKX2_9AGAR|nr:GTP-binding protein [Mycena sanguinolenta]
MDKAIDVRSKVRHFRILIIGRANAGKTTILKKVCNSVEDPEIYDLDGNKIDPEIVRESAERGEHNIENQLIFKSNPQFIFHDSRGFEGGSADEIQKVTAFIEKRAKTLELSKQLHAIWYCLPTDGNRPLLEAEDRFFQISGTGKVPLIVIFTKFDGLVTKAYQQLRSEGKNIRTANTGKVELAQTMLITNYIDPLKAATFKPSAYVQLDDMRLEHSSCIELINHTVNALTDDALLLLFVSVQRNNIDVCIWRAVDSAMAEEGLTSVVKWTLAYFPHVWHQSSRRDVSARSLRSPWLPANHNVISAECENSIPLSPPLFFTPPLFSDVQFEKNVAFCIDALKKKLPAAEELVRTPLGLAHIVARMEPDYQLSQY